MYEAHVRVALSGQRSPLDLLLYLHTGHNHGEQRQDNFKYKISNDKPSNTVFMTVVISSLINLSRVLPGFDVLHCTCGTLAAARLLSCSEERQRGAVGGERQASAWC